MKFSGLLYSKWKAHEHNKELIIGNWSEDNSEYDIHVPHQLRDDLVELQNLLYEKYKAVETLEKELKAKKNELNDVLGTEKEKIEKWDRCY